MPPHSDRYNQEPSRRVLYDDPPSNHALDKRLAKLEWVVERQATNLSKLMWIVVAGAVGLAFNALPTLIGGLMQVSRGGGG